MIILLAGLPPLQTLACSASSPCKDIGEKMFMFDLRENIFIFDLRENIFIFDLRENIFIFDLRENIWREKLIQKLLFWVEAPASPPVPTMQGLHLK